MAPETTGLRPYPSQPDGWAPPAHDGRGRPRSPDIAVCFSDSIQIKEYCTCGRNQAAAGGSQKHTRPCSRRFLQPRSQPELSQG